MILFPYIPNKVISYSSFSYPSSAWNLKHVPECSLVGMLKFVTLAKSTLN